MASRRPRKNSRTVPRLFKRQITEKPIFAGRTQSTIEDDDHPAQAAKVRKEFAHAVRTHSTVEDHGRPVRMHQVLEDFIEPFRESSGESEEGFRALLKFGVMVWNASVLAEQRGKALLGASFEAVVADLPDADQASARRMLEAMIERKQRCFAEHKRMILSFDLKKTGDEFFFKVFSME